MSSVPSLSNKTCTLPDAAFSDPCGRRLSTCIQRLTKRLWESIERLWTATCNAISVRKVWMNRTRAVRLVMSAGQENRKQRSVLPTTLTFLQSILPRFAHTVPVVCAKIHRHLDSLMEKMHTALNLLLFARSRSECGKVSGQANCSLMRGNNQKSHGAKLGL